jgi:transposase InsO family protein
LRKYYSAGGLQFLGLHCDCSSDQGKPFVSGMVKYLCAKVGTEEIETAPYYSQSDGCVERFN